MESENNRTVPAELGGCAARAFAHLRALADDPDTPEKTRMDIEKWFIELWYGKGPLCLREQEGGGPVTVRFEGVLEEWAK